MSDTTRFAYNPITDNMDLVNQEAGGDVSTITGDSGGAVGPNDSGNINLLGNELVQVVGTPGSNTQTLTPTSAAYPLSPFVVGIEGEAGYQTLQSAVDAAIASAIANSQPSATVYCQSATITENVDCSAASALPSGICIVGAVGLGDEGQCEIVGHFTPPSTGVFVLRNVKFTDPTHIFTSLAAGSTHISIIDAYFNVENGFTFDLPNWTGIFECFDTNPGTGNDGGVNNTGGATLLLYEAGLGVGSGQTMVLSGTSFSNAGEVGCPIHFVTGANFTWDNAVFLSAVQTLNNSTGSFNKCRMRGGASASLTHNSSAEVSVIQPIIDSSHNPSIDGSGAGVLSLGDLVFTDNSEIANTLTINWLVSKPSSTGAWDLISSVTIAGTPTTITFNSGLSIYNELMIVFNSLLNSTTNLLSFGLSINGGSTYAISSNLINFGSFGSGQASINFHSGAPCPLGGPTAFSLGPNNGWITIQNPNLTLQRAIASYFSDGTVGNSSLLHGISDSSIQINAIQIGRAGGTFTSGSVAIYGR